jgi:hypothetical protein
MIIDPAARFLTRCNQIQILGSKSRATSRYLIGRAGHVR